MQLSLFDSSLYVSQDGLDICFSTLKAEAFLNLSIGDKEGFNKILDKIRVLNKVAQGKGLDGLPIETWDDYRAQWEIKANSLISKIYKAMAAIDPTALGLSEADRKRQRLQRKLNWVGKMAAQRRQLREDDGYRWLVAGDGRLKPMRPL